jgi:SAM-dependent methyltransferase
LARVQTEQLANVSVEFCVADVAQAGWGGAISGAPFDCAVALAVLHHIPGFDLRARALREIVDLLEPDGYLILSTWQFLDSARLRRKIVDWTEVDIVEELLEPGDYLLDWKREGRGLRYCHLVDAAEVERLAAESGLSVRETFRAGGREGNLSLFAILDQNA